MHFNKQLQAKKYFPIKLKLIVLSSCFIILFFGCKKHTPQYPSNKGLKPDYSKQALLELNESMASKEDSLLEIYVQQLPEYYIKNELGFWYRITKKANGDYLKEKEKFMFSYTISTLNGEKIKSESAICELGKKELTTGLEEGLKLMKKGETAILIVPWYLAFGMQGNDEGVEPYTSVIYSVDLP